jgi:phosphate transport system permease protein
MATSSETVERRPLGQARSRILRRPGDLALHGITGLAAAAAVLVLVLLAVQVFRQAWPAISAFGLGFISSADWNPVTSVFGARDLIWGTAVASFVALLIAVPLAVAIALFLTELAPPALAAPIRTMVELLAAIPSVVLGLWGILVLGPALADHVEPWLGSALGFLPIFSGTPSAAGLLPACVVLTIMVVPIVAAISREVFLTVPAELKEGAYALGATRWEVVRGVVLPQSAGGITAAVIIGLGRALGEAIAVTQVIGGAAALHASLFEPADTLASRIASQYQGAVSNIQIASIAYLAAILLVLSLVVNVGAQVVISRFERRRLGVR